MSPNSYSINNEKVFDEGDFRFVCYYASCHDMQADAVHFSTAKVYHYTVTMSARSQSADTGFADATFLLTDWMAHVPMEALSKSFGLPISAFDHIPSKELYIFPAGACIRLPRRT